MKYVNAYPSLPIFGWLFLVAILVGIVLAQRLAGADTLHAWVETYRGNHAADRPLQAYVRQLYQPSNILFATVQPGRLGVTEQPGRRGVADQDGRPGADPDQAAREPLPPGGRLRPIIVEALLNRQVSVPLMVDTGATYTVVTRQTAQDLGIIGLERLPKHSFLTPGGPIQSPVTTLKSIRVGTVEAQNVAVAIDAEGHLPLGLLGMTFMRH
ncbi:MAG TPA: retropepsin-like aspartic protease, partial [Candidatus Tectomicrobia bacterium]